MNRDIKPPYVLVAKVAREIINYHNTFNTPIDQIYYSCKDLFRLLSTGKALSADVHNDSHNDSSPRPHCIRGLLEMAIMLRSERNSPSWSKLDDSRKKEINAAIVRIRDARQNLYYTQRIWSHSDSTVNDSAITFCPSNHSEIHQFNRNPICDLMLDAPINKTVAEDRAINEDEIVNYWMFPACVGRRILIIDPFFLHNASGQTQTKRISRLFNLVTKANAQIFGGNRPIELIEVACQKSEDLSGRELERAIDGIADAFYAENRDKSKPKLKFRIRFPNVVNNRDLHGRWLLSSLTDNPRQDEWKYEMGVCVEAGFNYIQWNKNARRVELKNTTISKEINPIAFTGKANQIFKTDETCHGIKTFTPNPKGSKWHCTENTLSSLSI